jgi:hypothetical protein
VTSLSNLDPLGKFSAPVSISGKAFVDSVETAHYSTVRNLTCFPTRSTLVEDLVISYPISGYTVLLLQMPISSSAILIDADP